MESKRRKIAPKGRTFEKDWEISYLFIEHNNQPQCLVCYEKLSAMKVFNVKRHYQTHSLKYDEYQDDDRCVIFEELKKKLQQQQSYFVNILTKADCAEEASYSVALEIAKSKGTCADGEFIKRCAVKMVKCFGEHKVAELIKSVSLSRETLSTRIDELNEYCEETLSLRIKNCLRYGLALDNCDLSSLMIIVRSVDDDLNVTEELLDLVEVLGEVKGIEIYEILNESFESYEKLSSVATDGSSVMRDLAGVFKEHGTKTVMLPCINMSSLCAKSKELNEVMLKVVKMINFLQGNKTLCQGKLKNLLEDEIPLESSKRWFSAGKCLENFYLLRSDIVGFLDDRMKTFNNDDLLKAQDFINDLKDPEFLKIFAFLCDITAKLSQLNLKLQGRHQTVSNLVAEIDGFQCKLRLWKNEIVADKLDYFPLCLELSKNVEGIFSAVPGILQTLVQEFEVRFVDFGLIRNYLKLFNNPMDANIEDQRSDLKMELCELQTDPFYLAKKGVETVEFWKLLDKEKFPTLRLFAAEVLSMFGSTNHCDAGLKFIKNKHRTKLGDLKATMRLALNDRDVNLKTLIRNKHKS